MNKVIKSHPVRPIKSQTILDSFFHNRKLKKATFIEASKYTLDLSKLVFGGVILVNIMSLHTNKISIFVMGAVAILILTAISFILFIKGKE